jgi:uncharacterized protein
MRFVFDTNILVSAIMLPHSVPAQALHMAEHQGIVLYSDETLEELICVLERPKFRPYIRAENIGELYARIRMHWHAIPIIQRVQHCRDPKDDKFLELAVHGEATTIITGDNDLLVLTPYLNINIIQPNALITSPKK